MPGCGRTHEARGLCHSHYAQLRRTGATPTAPFAPRTVDDRFWSKVDRSGECWIWRGATSGTGRYGTFWNGERNMPAHRWAFEQKHGPIAPSLVIDHLCRTTLCVRPSHLEAVTQRTNVLRGEAPSAINATKTHCDAGHDLAGPNLIERPRGGRACRECTRRTVREAQRRYRARRRAA